MSLWTSELSVGNRVLDTKHKNLHGIIREMAHLVVARDVADLPVVFDLLENCWRGCFTIEENIARAVGFDFAQHRQAHQQLLEEFRRMKGELISRNGRWTDDEGKGYASSMMHCLTRHIKEDSRQLKIVLDTHLYDFNP